MSKRKDPKGIRMANIRQMHRLISGAGDVELKRFLAWCSYNMGLTRKTARSYLQDLADLDFIEIDEVANLIREIVPEVVEE